MTMTDTRYEFDLVDRMLKSVRLAEIGRTELAERMGMSPNTITRWLNGKTTPRWRDLIAFAQVTGVELEWLDPEGCARRDLNPRPIGLEPTEPIWDCARERPRCAEVGYGAYRVG